jgi:tetratricopeptide (TPR) repeat protein
MALYNLGMVYSDQGRLDEALSLLKRATEVAPEHANSWTALGVAALRKNDIKTAGPALRKAVALEPENSYAQRTLGTLQSMAGDAEAAVKSLRTATTLAPNDAIALLTLAQTLLDQDPAAHADEADALLQRVMSLVPHGEIAEKAASLRTSIANLKFRSNAVGDLRHDAVFHCLGALERFEGMTQQQLAPLVMEMATLGQSGLNVNEPDTTYRLNLLPGEFSGLQVICMMHVGLKKMNPEMGSGMDIDKEYEAALSLYRRKKDG